MTLLTPKSPNWPQTITTTPIQNVLIINRPPFSDERGSFQELFRLQDLEKVLGETVSIQQANQSINKPRVLRGIHCAPWGKIVHCYYGAVFQVIIDLRQSSPTFKKVFSLEIGKNSPVSVWVPAGCGNGFCVVGKSEAVYGYSVTAVFQPGQEIGLKWDDEVITRQLKWPINNPIVSEKDNQNPNFKALFPKK